VKKLLNSVDRLPVNGDEAVNQLHRIVQMMLHPTADVRLYCLHACYDC